MRENLVELWRFRYLLWQLVRRDLKVRYKNSRLGFLWSIAPPLMQVAVITFAFKHATSYAREFPSYSAFVLVAIIPWTYFSTALLDASHSILSMYSVIKKVYLPREVIPLAAAISNFVHFLLSWVVFFVYWWGIRRLMGDATPVLASTLLFPFLLLAQFMLTTGLCLLVAALNVFYEDVKYMVQVLLGLGLFLFPIMFLVEQVQSNVGGRGPAWRTAALWIYRYNPLSVLITGYRKCLLESPDAGALGIPVWPIDYASLAGTGVLSLLVLAGCYAYFNRRKWQFVERP